MARRKATRDLPVLVTVFDLPDKAIHSLKLQFVVELENRGMFGSYVFNDEDRILTEQDLREVDRIVSDEQITLEYDDVIFDEAEVKALVEFDVSSFGYNL